ncbi:DUF4236 domain-containing protein [Rhodococcus marinonascens]|uniref:DUF4236 domain-containing protein n=1 Tax=Rhodococcus marinonascens TaxID=38311 RepID=UPI000932F6DB|nr:DUF4236 domain-containing protein [Rhodococcus marinonascens]
MGFRFQKRIKLAPGISLNVSKAGIGYSVGGKGVRMTRGANGRVTRTLSVPGTGLSHRQTLRGSSTRRSTSRRATSPQPQPTSQPLPVHSITPPPPPPRPQWANDALTLADSHDPTDFAPLARYWGPSMPELRILIATLEGLLHFTAGADDPVRAQRARELLAWSIAQRADFTPIEALLAELADHTWPVEIVHGVTANLHLGDSVATLAVAELHQAAGEIGAAIDAVEQIDDPATPAALSLADLYSEAGRDRDVIDLTNGVTNEDDATALLLALRGRAFARQGYAEAARESFKEALRVRTRSASVRHRALIERAQVDLAQNRKAAARKSLEKILAEDPAYPGLTEALAALPTV